MSEPSAEDALHNLQQVKHVVVLMKENRSFDQMLGYLTRAGMPDVDGLRGDELNLDNEGNEYHSFEWGADQTIFHPRIDPSGKILDPDHSKGGVAEQLEGDNGGFVKNFLKTRSLKGEHVELPEELRSVPMGHYGAQHLPVYDHIARNFCVCDAWHSSIPGDTWPNRLYSLAGEESEKIGYKRSFWGELLARLDSPVRETWQRPLEGAIGPLLCRADPGCQEAIQANPGERAKTIRETREDMETALFSQNQIHCLGVSLVLLLASAILH